MSARPTAESTRREIASYYLKDYDGFLKRRYQLGTEHNQDTKTWDRLYDAFRARCSRLHKRRKLEGVKKKPDYKEEWESYVGDVFPASDDEDDDHHPDELSGPTSPQHPRPATPSQSSSAVHDDSSSSPSSMSSSSSRPAQLPHVRHREEKDPRSQTASAVHHPPVPPDAALQRRGKDERKTDSAPDLSTSSAAASDRLQQPSQKVSMQDFLRALLPKIVEAQQVLLEPFLAKFLTAQQSQLELLQRHFAPPVDEELALSFGCRSCDSLKRQLEDAATNAVRRDAAYRPSRLLDSMPDHLSDVVPGVKEVWIEGDGQCALRAVAVGVWPSLGRGEDDERVADVRRDLLGELQRWSVGKWMNVVPGYGVRGLVVDDLEDDDRRTSYDFYLQYLSDPMHRSTHLDHAIFYLASSFYRVEFIIVALLTESRNKPSLYHRRINMVADNRRTIVVSHSHEHYSLLDIKAADTASLNALLSLPLQVQTSRWVDRDWCRWKANEVREEQSISEDEGEKERPSSPPPPSSVPVVPATSQSSLLSQIVKELQDDEMDVAAPLSDHRGIPRPSLPLSQSPDDARHSEDSGQPMVSSSLQETSSQDAPGPQQDRFANDASRRDGKARKRRRLSAAADADQADHEEQPACPTALSPTAALPPVESVPTDEKARSDGDESIAHADDEARVQSLRSHNRFYRPPRTKNIPASGGAGRRARSPSGAG
jgi:hypothetical protein